MGTEQLKQLHDLLAIKGMVYLRYELSVFGWSVAASWRNGMVMHSLSSTDGEATVVAVDYMDRYNADEYSDFETLDDSIKFLQLAIDKS